ncbi:MAG TPA: lysylphosphatidylglycerol synthase transmembrane domain-containing protein [Acetobacteraceae bacterium]|nr:lysylphosphatidylglycerol synthase transmembrane domain-containing protein [Acetobacteraceae bacterium]
MSLSRRTWPVLVKLAVLAAAFGLMMHFGIVSPAALALAIANPLAVFAALSMMMLGAQLNVLRWHLLLHWQGSPLRFGQTWQISYISYFVGSFLPGAAGGDALRALYLLRECPDTRAAALLTIVFDRILGLGALLLLVLGLAAAMPHEVLQQPVLLALVLIAVAAVPGLIVALPLLSWLLSHAHRLKLQRMARGAEHLAKAIMRPTATWRGQPGRVTLALLLGVVSHALVAASIVTLARAMGVGTLSVWELALAGTLAVLANQLPLTPGGLGIGETSFAQICLLLAPGSAALASGSTIFVFRLINLISFLPGALALLTFRHSAAASHPSAKARSIADSTSSTSASSSAG